MAQTILTVFIADKSYKIILMGGNNHLRLTKFSPQQFHQRNHVDIIHTLNRVINQKCLETAFCKNQIQRQGKCQQDGRLLTGAHGI